MRKTILLAMILLATLPGSLFAQSQDCEAIKQAKLKELLTQLGYPVRDADTARGKEKFEIKTTKDGIDVPIVLQISSSGMYMWLTVSLGNALSDESILNASLLKHNSKIQPCQFYVTDSGKLMMGLAVDNRGINNLHLRRYIEFITARVTETKSYWMR